MRTDLVQVSFGKMSSWGYGDCVVMSDQEPAISAVVEGVQNGRTQRTLHRKIPRYPHASLGYAEQGNWTLEAMARTLFSHLEQHYRRVGPTEPIAAWVLRHAGWLATKFRVREDGRTAHYLLKHSNYRGEVAELGEIVWARDPTPSADQHKHDRCWRPAVWLGKVEESYAKLHEMVTDGARA